MRLRALIHASMLIFLFAPSSRAQSPYGTISGIVVDPTGAVIANAEILVVNDATRVQYPAKTNAEGIYIVANLPPGPYRIQIAKSGFKTVIKPDISLNVQDSMGAIYHVHWSSIFSLFGCNLGDFGRDQALFAPRKTQLASHAVDARDTLVVPMKSREELELDRTNLLSRLAEIWGEIPIRLIQHLDLRNGVYGFVGMSDRTMYPIIRPGSIVQIDQNQQKILPLKWQNEHERPIYFIELRGQYICSWCEMREGYLSAVPHPNSKCEVRRFSYPREAEIVGRVIGVTMRLVEAE